MRLTPLDIRKQEFTRGFRGYEPDEVNAFLQMVSNQWDEFLDESRRKDEKIRQLESKMDHYEKVEEALQEALQTARDTSRKALQNAEDKARLIVDEAERRAEDIKRDAEQDRHQIKRETAKLSGRRSEIVSRLRAFLMSEMELLARFEGDDPVGFIKLLPAEERRIQEAPIETHQGGSAAHRTSRPDTPAEMQPAVTSTSTPDVAEHGREQTSSRREEDRPYDQSESAQERDEALHNREMHGPSETSGRTYEEASTEADDHAAEQASTQEVMHGPGWTARTVISRPSEQASSRSENPPGHEEEGGEDTTARSSSDEIEKIRRILSDLDD